MNNAERGIIASLVKREIEANHNAKSRKQKANHRKYKYDRKSAQYRVDTKVFKEKIKKQAHALSEMQKEISILKICFKEVSERYVSDGKPIKKLVYNGITIRLDD